MLNVAWGGGVNAAPNVPCSWVGQLKKKTVNSPSPKGSKGAGRKMMKLCKCLQAENSGDAWRGLTEIFATCFEVKKIYGTNSHGLMRSMTSGFAKKLGLDPRLRSVEKELEKDRTFIFRSSGFGDQRVIPP